MFKQLHKRLYGESPVLYTGVHVHLLGDDQCVDVMNKTLIIDAFINL